MAYAFIQILVQLYSTEWK